MGPSIKEQDDWICSICGRKNYPEWVCCPYDGTKFVPPKVKTGSIRDEDLAQMLFEVFYNQPVIDDWNECTSRVKESWVRIVKKARSLLENKVTIEPLSIKEVEDVYNDWLKRPIHSLLDLIEYAAAAQREKLTK